MNPLRLALHTALAVPLILAQTPVLARADAGTAPPEATGTAGTLPPPPAVGTAEPVPPVAPSAPATGSAPATPSPALLDGDASLLIVPALPQEPALPPVVATASAAPIAPVELPMATAGPLPAPASNAPPVPTRDAVPPPGPVDAELKAASMQLRARVGAVYRSLSFRQDVYQRLRTLRTSAAVYRLDAAIYPALSLVPLQGRIGFIAAYEGTLTGSARDQDFHRDYDLSHSELYGGLRIRRDVLQHEIGFEVTVGRLHSGLENGSRLAGVPDASYTEVRSALDFGMRFNRARVTASTGFRVPFGYGELEHDDWFPRLGGYALEGELSGSYQLTHGVSLEAAANLRRYVLEMNSEPEDAGTGRAEVAGGAVDAYWGGYLGMSFKL